MEQIILKEESFQKNSDEADIKLKKLRKALIEGEQSETSDFTVEDVIAELDEVELENAK